MNHTSFWHFSAQAYGGMETEFLQLQNKAGLQINMILLCGWLGRSNKAIKNMQSLIKICNEWDEFLIPFRKIRSQIKQHESLYEACKKLELQFEKACQDALLAAVETQAKGSVKSNIALYLSHSPNHNLNESAIHVITTHLQEVIIHGSP